MSFEQCNAMFRDGKVALFPCLILFAVHVLCTGFTQYLCCKIKESFEGTFKEILPKINDKYFRNCITMEYEKGNLGVT